MIAIRLSEEVELRLENLARRTGRTKSFYVREAILEHLEDLEDTFLPDDLLSYGRARGQALQITDAEIMAEIKAVRRGK